MQKLSTNLELFAETLNHYAQEIFFHKELFEYAVTTIQKSKHKRRRIRDVEIASTRYAHRIGLISKKVESFDQRLMRYCPVLVREIAELSMELDVLKEIYDELLPAPKQIIFTTM